MRVSVGFFNQEVSDLGERKSTNTGLQSAVTQAYTGTMKCLNESCHGRLPGRGDTETDVEDKVTRQDIPGSGGSVHRSVRKHCVQGTGTGPKCL